MTVNTISTGNAVKKLMSSWRITAVEDNKSEITFAMDYEMKSPMLQMIMKGMFDSAARKILSAFEARATKLYKS
jgi:coenzyme Q-binding protein COQ10